MLSVAAASWSAVMSAEAGSSPRRRTKKNLSLESHQSVGWFWSEGLSDNNVHGDRRRGDLEIVDDKELVLFGHGAVEGVVVPWDCSERRGALVGGPSHFGRGEWVLLLNWAGGSSKSSKHQV